MIKFIFSILLSFQTIALLAQTNIEHQNLAWYNLGLKVKINSKSQFRFEVHERHFFLPNNQHLFLIRSSYLRTLYNGWSFGSGLGYFISGGNIPLSNQVTGHEIRPHADFIKKIKINSGNYLQHRLRTELRFNDNQKDESFQPEFSSIRSRYQFSGSFSLIKNKDNYRNIMSIKPAAEAMIQLGTNQNFFDQSRLYLGLQWLPNENTEIEIGFLHQFLQKSDATGFFNRSILRLGIEQTLATKPRKKTS